MKPKHERIPNLALAQKLRGEAKQMPEPFWSASMTVLPPPLPPIARKHDDLEAINKAVFDAVSVSGPLWLSYLFSLFYIALAASGVKHVDLFLESPVELPFLNINLALVAFFLLAPLLLLLLHAYTLMYFVLLGNKASQFHNQLYKQIPKDEKICEGLRRQLPNNIFVQFLAGPKEFREGSFGWLLKLIAWTTLVIAPMAVLLLLQVQFLPYQDRLITWIGRLAILLDYLLIGWLWPSILGEGTDLLEGWRWWLGSQSRSAMAAVGLVAVVFSWTIATFPGEWRDLRYSPIFSPLESYAVAATDLVFGEPNDFRSRRWPANRLWLPEIDIVEVLKTEPEKINRKEHSFDLQGRNLEYANFFRANLGKIDARGTNLRGAVLVRARLQGAWLDDAKLDGASLDQAELQGARLDRAQLQRANLSSAQLQGARLIDAGLQGAVLSDARLDGAWLTDAHLRRAVLIQAELQGASLTRAELQGSKLMYARLQGAWLDDAKLGDASLNGAELQGASLRGAQFQGASLDGAFLWRADWGELSSRQVSPISLENAHWDAVATEGAISTGRTIKPWGDGSYSELQKKIEAIPDGEFKAQVLQGIARLDCKRLAENLASCDPKAPEPPSVKLWRETLENASDPRPAPKRRTN